MRSYLGEKVETPSKTAWEGNKLVTRYSYSIYAASTIPTASKENESISTPVQIIERYALSEDGNTLTILIESRVDFSSSGFFQGASNNTKHSQHVYRKKS